MSGDESLDFALLRPLTQLLATMQPSASMLRLAFKSFHGGLR
jgi:hypothetical protein